MVIYIEYAFLENFLFDCVLLYLALKAVKEPIKLKNLCLSACIGGVFAVVFPLLELPKLLAYLCKFSVGFLMCLLITPSLKTKNDRGRYAFTCVCFFSFSFFFGGVILALLQEFFPKKTPSLLVMACFACLSFVVIVCIEKFYAKRAVNRFLYDCQLTYKDVKVQLKGFLDSGNLAKKNGLPVCFISPEYFYELFSEEYLKDGRQVLDEIQIQTVNGEKSCPVFKGEIELFFTDRKVKRLVYFGNATHILSKGYQVIISGYLLDDEAYKENVK